GSGPSSGPSATAAAACSAPDTEPATAPMRGDSLRTFIQWRFGFAQLVQPTPGPSQVRGSSSVKTPPRQRSPAGPGGKIVVVFPEARRFDSRQMPPESATVVPIRTGFPLF